VVGGNSSRAQYNRDGKYFRVDYYSRITSTDTKSIETFSPKKRKKSYRSETLTRPRAKCLWRGEAQSYFNGFNQWRMIHCLHGDISLWRQVGAALYTQSIVFDKKKFIINFPYLVFSRRRQRRRKWERCKLYRMPYVILCMENEKVPSYVLWCAWVYRFVRKWLKSVYEKVLSYSGSYTWPSSSSSYRVQVSWMSVDFQSSR